VEQCDHCGKSLRKKTSETTDSSGLTNLDSWKEKSVPAWVMYAVVAVLLFCVVLMIGQGCEKFKTRQPRDAGASRCVEPSTNDSPIDSLKLSLIPRSAGNSFS
jgi:hypothetical protein